MNEVVIRQKLAYLCDSIAKTPCADGSTKVDDGIYISNPGIDKATIEQSLETLRLQMKYLVFDLEATRRENRYLRHMLDSRRRPDRNDGPDNNF